MSLIDVKKLVGKNIFADSRCPVYSSATNNAKPAFYANYGDLIGVCDSWLEPSGWRSEYWLVILNGTKSVYVKFSDAKYLSEKKVIEQGVKTVAQEVEESRAAENPESFGDKAISTTKNLIVFGIILFAGIFLIKTLKR